MTREPHDMHRTPARTGRFAAARSSAPPRSLGTTRLAVAVLAAAAVGLGLGAPAADARAPHGTTTAAAVRLADVGSGGRSAANGAVGAVSSAGPDDVWAVGEGGTRALAQHWDGTSWTHWVLPGVPRHAQAATVSGVARIAADDVWVVGEVLEVSGLTDALVDHWDGTSWHHVVTPQPKGASAFLTGVSGSAADDVWAVGTSSATGAPTSDPYVLHWDGSSWSTVRTPQRNPETGAPQSNAPADVVAISADDAWMVGQATAARGRQISMSEHWDGHRWHVVELAQGKGTDDWLNSVSSTSAHDVWAVGARVSELGKTLVVRNEAGTWRRTASDSPTSHAYLLAVDAVSAHDAWAVGYLGLSGGTGLVEHSTGGRWQTQPPPSDVGALLDVSATADDDVWVGGTASAGGLALLSHWDGTSWTRVPFTG
jgi:hypothetical protein